ncbi:hypothetical protein COV88_00680 [Candidatus Saccharibacteria bacterium CG11_big_fil_rev_8_21_14_0_20_41_19]|nr:hypothetical protein [Candidatus Saccharibacteria bacterium]OIP86179.1 MAG: hypothetical protein AUK57_00155 [Candidatus Saccharibacteria bacterium CG2_30_41_52]PIQ70989.1 MAG: hypothetical protein COV88_00680 [Candidatus Saccharibacteria bacterium CG11_big_fil_rev_8_21_14_0_20_41_19]PIZ60467.1 MAG: hypothetical protein COY18_01275 [Candidatus Saccharibacteria bacterium CG_4_10_14_0_2_um_filter_41_11]PJC29560.1 MAG: hypothetical protein CO052_02690 [Candidatus Saccharibacteria bacterium CG_4
MARFLQQLLDAQEPMFSRGIAMLEKSTGHSSVDVRLIADITEQSHAIMRQLGLDTSDTTGRELYGALISAVHSGSIETLLEDADYVMMKLDGKIISFNMIDVIENAHHKLPYANQTITHGQRSLRGELLSRYIDHARTDEVTTRQIAESIGLLPGDDAWYNFVKYHEKQTAKPVKEFIK